VNVAGSAGLLLMAGAASQLSDAVAPGPVYVAWQFALVLSVTFAGQVMTGAIASTRVTVWVQVLVLPETSLAVQTML
jgi:hypothetical protein